MKKVALGVSIFSQVRARDMLGLVRLSLLAGLHQHGSHAGCGQVKFHPTCAAMNVNSSCANRTTLKLPDRFAYVSKGCCMSGLMPSMSCFLRTPRWCPFDGFVREFEIRRTSR